MKKINMRGFKVKVYRDGEQVEVDYAIKDSIIEILFNPSLKLNGSRILKQDELAKKVLASEDDLILEEEEYQRIKEAFEKVEGLGKNDVELVSRIINAEKVEVEVK